MQDDKNLADGQNFVAAGAAPVAGAASGQNVASGSDALAAGGGVSELGVAQQAPRVTTNLNMAHGVSLGSDSSGEQNMTGVKADSANEKVAANQNASGLADEVAPKVTTNLNMAHGASLGGTSASERSISVVADQEPVRGAELVEQANIAVGNNNAAQTTEEAVGVETAQAMPAFVMRGEKDEVPVAPVAPEAGAKKKTKLPKLNLKGNIKLPKLNLSAKQKKIWLIVACSVVGLIVVGGILTLILLPKAFQVDYRSAYAKGKDASDAMYGVTAFESCRGVIRSVDSSYTTKKTYSNYVQKCRDNLEILKTTVSELAKESTLAGDEELGQEWAKFREIYEKTMPVYEKMLEIYPDWHDFSVNIVELTTDSNWWKTATDASVDAAYAPIVESDNARLSEWGVERASLYKKYVRAYREYKEAYDAYYAASYSAPNKTALREDMQVKSAASDEAYEIFKKYNTDNVISLTEVLGADLLSDDYNVSEYMSDLFDALHAKYLEAYLQREGDLNL